ncbi:rhodanese-like domain-containing protein [Roseimaritima ulvae]|uniref:Putative adenylyltransferase/sulfurtransferase MoeZ n=1 Tax=Roseimaritima ulvae TaxID=980254 RepID=A0A5B9QX51_9BACT|nr:rhodanese-like domain-containing protein [Roseimaritima ulvae]QEG43634.1 putative adenylyltransferase/sulfurtransferase MoeZ [Roseimaritima ulvae]
MSSDSELPIEIDVHSVHALREAGESFVFLDVREQDEYETARIDGARLLPLSELQERAKELQEHIEDRVIVHCHHGGRSLRVVAVLRQSGFKQAQNMTGGIDHWSQHIDPSVPRY